MKKRTVLLLAVLMLFALAAPCAAEETQMQVPEADMQLTLPENWYVLTPDTVNDPLILDALNVTKEEAAAYFEGTDLCLEAVPGDGSLLDLNVTCRETDESRQVFDYRIAGAETLEEKVIPALRQQLNDSGYLAIELQVYQTDAALFLYQQIEGKDGICSRSYTSCYNGRSIVIELTGIESEMEQGSEQLRNVVDSIRFTKTLEPPAQGIDRGKVARNAAIGGVAGAALALLVRRVVKKDRKEEETQ